MIKGKIKNCGNCRGFQKLKNDMNSGGMCDIRDFRVNTDSRCCDFWKANPYKRIKNIKVNIGEIKSLLFESIEDKDGFI